MQKLAKFGDFVVRCLKFSATSKIGDLKSDVLLSPITIANNNNNDYNYNYNYYYYNYYYYYYYYYYNFRDGICRNQLEIVTREFQI